MKEFTIKKDEKMYSISEAQDCSKLIYGSSDKCDFLKKVEQVISDEETHTFDFIQDTISGFTQIYFDELKCFYIDDDNYGIDNDCLDKEYYEEQKFVKKHFSELKVGDIWLKENTLSPIGVNYIVNEHNDQWVIQRLIGIGIGNVSGLICESYNKTENMNVWVAVRK